MDKSVPGAEKALPEGTPVIRKIAGYLRKNWLSLLLIAVLMLTDVGYEWYVGGQSFEAQELLTEAEFRELVEWADYIGENSAPGTIRTWVPNGRDAWDYFMRDLDGDDKGDLYVYLRRHGPNKATGWRSVWDENGVERLEEFAIPWEPQELVLRGEISRAHWKDVLQGEVEWGAYSELLIAEDHTGSLMIVTNVPKDEARSCIRAEIDRMLGLIREAEAAGIEAQ